MVFRLSGQLFLPLQQRRQTLQRRQTADLLDIIKANGVHAIFSENMANPKLAQTLSEEAGVQVGPVLYTDAFGPCRQ